MYHLCTRILMSNAFLHICVPLTISTVNWYDKNPVKYNIVSSAPWWASLELKCVKTACNSYQILIILPEPVCVRVCTRARDRKKDRERLNAAQKQLFSSKTELICKITIVQK